MTDITEYKNINVIEATGEGGQLLIDNDKALADGLELVEQSIGAIEEVLTTVYSATETNTAISTAIDDYSEYIEGIVATKLNEEEVGDIVGGALASYTPTTNLLSDPAPKLGANLDCLTQSITTTTVNGAIKLVPNGTGAIQGRTNGNARGSYAVDLQTYPNLAAQVASGSNSTIGGGANHTASGTFSTIAGGASNLASGTRSTVAGGYGNSSTLTYASIGGGQNNTASGEWSCVTSGNANFSSGNYSVIAGGSGNTANGAASSIIGGLTAVASGSNSCVVAGKNSTASGLHSTILGGWYNTASSPYSRAMGYGAVADHYGETAIGSSVFSVFGDAQTCIWNLKGVSISGAAINLTLDGTQNDNEVSIPAIGLNDCYSYIGTVVVKGSTGVGAYRIEGLINQNGLGTTSHVGNVTPISALSGCSLAVDVSTNLRWKLKATAPGAGYRWVATLILSKVNYGGATGYFASTQPTVQVMELHDYLAENPDEANIWAQLDDNDYVTPLEG